MERIRVEAAQYQRAKNRVKVMLAVGVVVAAVGIGYSIVAGRGGGR